MYSFRIHIHRRPPELGEGAQVELDRGAVRTLDIAMASESTSLFVTFDRAAEILATLPRMFIEPDGSLVWTGEHNGESWQLDGVLYDEGPRLAYVQLAGCCPPDEFDQFLAALGWPALPLMFQWTPAGVFLPEEDFRRIARQ